MIKYQDLVDYTKNNHVRWDTELFTVLRDFFESYCHKQTVQMPTASMTITDTAKTTPVPFTEPSDGEYTANDVLALFSN